ncbi:MAG TPA: hypothetical protein VM010_03420, partial [Chitinophagaceae bacterium]|nr:hypothetical protein [Chitinophagaceae bacterium]
MNFKLPVPAILSTLLISSVFFFYKPVPEKKVSPFKILPFKTIVGDEAEGEESEAEELEFTKGRIEHEFKMLRNPVTGTIPHDFHVKELQAARTIPDRYPQKQPWLAGVEGANGTTNQNVYESIGPNNVAGRSRTLAFDRRNPSIMLTGGTTGGIFRSTNGGDSWTFVSPENEIRSATAIVQDPLRPDTWYCGTGEVYHIYSSQSTAATVGYGIFKSINNGVTWTKLPSTEGNENLFDNVFDLVHRMAV